MHSTCRKMYFSNEVLFSEIHSKKILSTLIKCYLGGALESTLLLSGRTFWARCSEKHQCFHVFFATVNKQLVMWFQFNVSPARGTAWAKNIWEKLENSEFFRFELECFVIWFHVCIICVLGDLWKIPPLIFWKKMKIQSFLWTLIEKLFDSLSETFNYVSTNLSCRV